VGFPFAAFASWITSSKPKRFFHISSVSVSAGPHRC
jgi:hypothetical protein